MAERMTYDELTTNAIIPSWGFFPSKFSSDSALVQLLVTADQESNLEHRRQLVGSPPRPTGPAMSFWQAEKGGGMVAGVRMHHVTKKLAAEVYAARGVAPNNQAIWEAIENDDILAAALARLLYYSDPFPLPKVGDAEGAWQQYLRIWRPGAYSRGTAEQRKALKDKFFRKYEKVVKYVNSR